MIALLQISFWVWWWKNFENRSIFGEASMDKSIVSRFLWLIVYNVTHVCDGLPVHLHVSLGWRGSPAVRLSQVLAVSSRPVPSHVHLDPFPQHHSTASTSTWLALLATAGTQYCLWPSSHFTLSHSQPFHLYCVLTVINIIYHNNNNNIYISIEQCMRS